MEVDPAPRRRVLEPVPLVRRRQPRLLAYALRPDHDVGQLEAHVRKRAQERAVEGPRPVVPLPAVAGRHDLVHAVGRQRGDQPLQVPPVLGQRVRLPQIPHRGVLRAAELALQLLADIVAAHVLGHRASRLPVRLRWFRIEPRWPPRTG